jgi:hypothetical protein
VKAVLKKTWKISMKQINFRNLIHYLTLIFVISTVLFLCSPLSITENHLNFQAAVAKQQLNQTVKLLITPDTEPWLLPIMAPLAAHLGKKTGTPPFFSVIPVDYPKREVALSSKIAHAHKLLVATHQQMGELSGQASELAGRVISVPNQKTAASLQIAQRFWPRSPHVIAAWVDDTESILIGATLAAHYAVPFLFFSHDWPTYKWLKHLNALKVQKITLISQSKAVKWSWLDKYYQVSRDPPEKITTLLVQQLGQSLENILLARLPIFRNEIGENTWLVPYISLLRKSLPLLLNTDDPNIIEKNFSKLIQKYALKPSSITLLGTQSAIGMYDYQIESAYAQSEAYNYELPVEMLTYPENEEQALSFGIGRIPFDYLYQTATLFVRGLYREELFQQQSHRILMVSNLVDDEQEKGLLLCETVSQATSQELRNFSLNVDEFYRRLASDSDIMKVTENADLIIFQGHAYHQRFVTEPVFSFESEMAYFQNDDNKDNDDIYVTDYKMEPIDSHEAQEPIFTDSDSPFKSQAFLTSETESAMPESDFEFNHDSKRFKNLPIVILQSCHSLENETPEWLLQLGGVALIGSVTSIHSASGSSFIKTLIDRALYEGENLGTALRDARNYFYVLQDLKNQRNHREQAKSLRVALSFRLFGDPQLKVFKSLPAPRKKGLSVVWSQNNILTIRTPTKRLPKIETEKYIAHGFPGVEYAGLVKSLKNKEARKLIPLYFVKTPLTAPIEHYQSMTVLKGKRDRVAYRIDPLTKQLYLLYLTEKERQYPTLRFKFSVKSKNNVTD